MNIVLYQPEIPHNTGAVGRTCLAAGAKLHLIHPLGFLLSQKHLARAGMDYWQHVDVVEYADFDDFLTKNAGARIFLAETRGAMQYTDVAFAPDDFIVFGCETKGLPRWLLEQYHDSVISIPMKNKQARSLNLSVTVGIILFEALRQLDLGDSPQVRGTVPCDTGEITCADL